MLSFNAKFSVLLSYPCIMSIFVVNVILINHYVGLNFVAGRLVADKVYIILLDL